MIGLGGAALAAEGPTSEDCLGCHADKDLARGAPAPGRGASVFVDVRTLQGSAHAALQCVACHATATAPHEETLPPVNCAGCHDKAGAALATGVHGTARSGRGPRAVTCTSCHGTHGIARAAAMPIDACAACHALQARAYATSIHGRSRQGGDTEAATCRSCHGPAHTAVDKADPESPVYHLNLPRTCAQCHADVDLARRHRIRVGNVYRLYMDSIHGRAVTRSGLLVAPNCSDCHGSHGIRPRTDPTSRVFRATIPETCGHCHAGILKVFAGSIHAGAPGGGRDPAAVCTDCHSAHQIRRVEATPWQLDVIRECGTCHQAELKTYRSTFHGKVTELGFTRVAKCADCHGFHDVLPASDPRSMVSSARLVETCRQCHPGATPAFTQFHPHADPEDRARFPLLHGATVFMTILLAGTFAFFGLHTLLWFPRSLIERLRRRQRRGPDGDEAP